VLGRLLNGECRMLAAAAGPALALAPAPDPDSAPAGQDIITRQARAYTQPGTGSPVQVLVAAGDDEVNV